MTELENLYMLARQARDCEDYGRAETYYNEIRLKDSSDWEACFYSMYCKARDCKIAEIKKYALLLKNSQKMVLELVKNNIANIEEQERILGEVGEEIKKIYKCFYYNEKNRLEEAGDYIKVDITEKVLDSSIVIVEALYAFGENVEDVFGKDFAPAAKNACWLESIFIHKEILPYFKDKKMHLDVLFTYVNKVLVSAEEVAKYFCEQAESAIIDEEFELAEAYCDKVLQEDAENYFALGLKGKISARGYVLHQYKLDTAIEFFNKCIESAPKSKQEEAKRFVAKSFLEILKGGLENRCKDFVQKHDYESLEMLIVSYHGDIFAMKVPAPIDVKEFYNFANEEIYNAVCKVHKATGKYEAYKLIPACSYCVNALEMILNEVKEDEEKKKVYKEIISLKRSVLSWLKNKQEKIKLARETIEYYKKLKEIEPEQVIPEEKELVGGIPTSFLLTFAGVVGFFILSIILLASTC